MNKLIGATVALGWSGSAIAATAIPSCELSGLQVAAGHVTFANTMMFLCAVGGILFGGMLLFHMRSLFEKIPLAAWKGFGYAVIASLCASSLWMDGDSAKYVEFVGAALGAGALAVILSDVADLMGIKSKDGAAVYAAVAVLGGLLAAAQHNEMVAGVAVAGAMALMGFTAFSFPGMVGMGFESRHALWRSVSGALSLLIPAAAFRAAFGSLGSVEVFWPAIGWLCSAVAGIGLLIASSRYFDSKGGIPAYAASNLAMVAFVAFCMWCGGVHGMVEMQRVAGTLAVVWLFEKPWDIPKRGALAYSALGAATCWGLFMVVREVGAHPERWSHFVLF